MDHLWHANNSNQIKTREGKEARDRALGREWGERVTAHLLCTAIVSAQLSEENEPFGLLDIIKSYRMFCV